MNDIVICKKWKVITLYVIEQRGHKWRFMPSPHHAAIYHSTLHRKSNKHNIPNKCTRPPPPSRAHHRLFNGWRDQERIGGDIPNQYVQPSE